MKQSKLFRTWRKGKKKQGRAGWGKRGERSREQKYVPIPAVLLMLSEAERKCSTWFLLLICYYFQLRFLRDNFAWSVWRWYWFWPSVNTVRKVLWDNREMHSDWECGSVVGMDEFIMHRCIYMCILCIALKESMRMCEFVYSSTVSLACRSDATR